MPVTRKLTDSEIQSDYEFNTGKVILELFKTLDHNDMKAALVHSHTPFVWGESPNKTVEKALVLEQLAKMALNTEKLSHFEPMQDELLEKHFKRKHGENAYYGKKDVEF